MKMRFTIAAAVASLLSGFAAGQTGPQQTTSPERASRWLRLSGQLRGRYEMPSGDGLVTGDHDAYLLSRARLNISLTPARWLSLYSELQDTHAAGYNGTAPASLRDPLDLRNAWIQIGGGEGSSVAVRAGRQDVHLGAGRLIGYPDWGNSSRSFDAVRGTFNTRYARFELLAGSVVLTDGTRFDRHKSGEHVYASYNTFTHLVPGAAVDGYLIIKSADAITSEVGRAGDGLVFTGGARVAGKRDRADYSFELANQWGTWAADTIGSTAGTYTVGWLLKDSSMKPRLSADFSHASGDRSPKDGRRGTFDVLYANQQPYFSLTGLLGWRNTRAWRAGLDLQLTKFLRMTVDGRDFRLATIQDGLYNGSGTRVVLNRNATTRHIGEGLDSQLVWTLSHATQVSVGVGRVFASGYLKESGKGNFTYPFISCTKRF